MKKPYYRRNKSLFWAVREILFTIAKKIGFDKERLKKLEKISRIVFSGRENDWKMQFKFDVSFNITDGEIQGVRFSCNNKNEGYYWIKKIDAIFNIFPGVYNQRKIFDSLKKERFDSLTIGFDWFQEEEKPKFKIYFEGNKNKIERFVKNVLNVKVLKLEKFISKGLLPCALGINFLPNNRITHKIYFYINENKLGRVLGKNQLPFVQRKISKDNKDYFFLLAINLSEKNNIISKKIYLIFETKEFQKKSKYIYLLERYNVIKNILTKRESKSLDTKINLFYKKTFNKFLFYPIGFSIGLTPKYNFGHKNIYISLIKKNAEK